MKSAIPVLVLLFCLPALLGAQDRATASANNRDGRAAASANRMLLRAELARGDAQEAPLRLDLPEAGGGARKSQLLAVLYSVLLPGMGELYADRSDRMMYPLVSEGVLWLGLAGVNLYAGAVRDDARVYARQHAGVGRSDLEDEYYVAIGNYNSIDEYNDAQLVERDIEALYTGDLYASRYWKWDAAASRLEYRGQRILSDDMFNAGRFFVAGLIINRIWSAVESAFFVRRYNQTLAAAPSLHSEFLMRNGSIDGLQLRLSAVVW